MRVAYAARPGGVKRPRDESATGWDTLSRCPRQPRIAALGATHLRAECGDAEAQFQLASALSDDSASIPNRVEIYKWYRLSELGDYEPASDRLDGLLVAMTPGEVAEGQDLVRGWSRS